MAVKIESFLEPAVAFHIIDGPTTFHYGLDARSAVGRFPGEWSHTPWSREDEARAREASGAPVQEITAEEQAAIDEHAKAVSEANERLKVRREKLAAEKVEADQVVRDEALVNSPPPRPEPRAKPLTPAQIRKRSAELTPEEQREADERIVREKAAEDDIARASAGGAPITG
jgi:hypothetical protein